MKHAIDTIQRLGVIPVVALDDAADAEPLAQALCGGGLPCAEITFRTHAALDAIRIMAKTHPQMLVGAGTVLSVEQAERAADAGAAFIVSPCFDAPTAEFCIRRNIPIFPGCVTPSEIMRAQSCGLDVVKFFPAEQFGGAAAIRALSAPFPGVRFIPTGGVDPSNLQSYLDCGAVLACGGSWIAPRSLIREKNFAAVRTLAGQAAAAARKI